MSSRNGERDGGWSLTRRVTRTTIGTSITSLALFAGLGLVVFYDMMRADLGNLVDHETQELSMAIDVHGTDDEGVAAAAALVAGVIDDPAVGFRVRRGTAIVAEAGDRAVLKAAPEPVYDDTSWRRHLFDQGLVIGSRTRPDGLRIEVMIDAHDFYERALKFLRWSGIAFVVVTLGATIASWLLARRAMASLRSVAEQSTRIDPITSHAQIDVTGAPVEVEALGASLNGMLTRIEASSNHLRTFSAFLAHELRSPLQNLIGETQVTLLSRREPAEYEALLRSNLDDLYDLSDAITNLVAYCASADERDAGADHETFDVLREAELRMERERRTAERRGITLTLRAEGDTSLRADREGCLRVLRNLVGNALDACAGGDRVEITIVGTRDALELRVTDTGPGVSDEVAERLFEPFVTAKVREDRRGGYGLGLAIGRSVMEDHGGTLAFENLPDGGARFVARFPRDDVATAARPPEIAAAITKP